MSEEIDWAEALLCIPKFDPSKDKEIESCEETLKSKVCSEWLAHCFLAKLRRLPYDPQTNPDQTLLVIIQ